MIQKRWNILTADNDKVEELQKALTINYDLCKILIQRGIDTFDKAKQYFRPQLSDLHDPFLMKDMDKAVNRILSAIEKKKKYLFLAIMMLMELLL